MTHTHHQLFIASLSLAHTRSTQTRVSQDVFDIRPVTMHSLPQSVPFGVIALSEMLNKVSYINLYIPHRIFSYPQKSSESLTPIFILVLQSFGVPSDLPFGLLDKLLRFRHRPRRFSSKSQLLMCLRLLQPVLELRLHRLSEA